LEGARAGLIKNFTGIDDPYEPPEGPDVVVDASRMTPEEAVQRILAYLEEKGYISRSRKGDRQD
jgi:sulfate adenylyltransferase